MKEHKKLSQEKLGQSLKGCSLLFCSQKITNNVLNGLMRRSIIKMRNANRGFEIKLKNLIPASNTNTVQ